MTTVDERLQHWGLQRAAFADTRDPSVYVPTPDAEEAVARLSYFVRSGEGRIGLLTGGNGCGKSLIAQVLAERVQSPDRPTVLLPVCAREPRFVLAEAIGALVEDGVDFDTYEDHLLRRAFTRIGEQVLRGGRRRLTIILDEAHRYSDEALLDIADICNLGDRSELPVTIILVGLPDLTNRLDRLPAIEQRIGIRSHVAPLPAEQIGSFLQYRLMAAGDPPNEVFTASAITQLQETTGGVPRLLCRYARLSMDNAFANQNSRVDADQVADVLRQEEAHSSDRTADSA